MGHGVLPVAPPSWVVLSGDPDQHRGGGLCAGEVAQAQGLHSTMAAAGDAVVGRCGRNELASAHLRFANAGIRSDDTAIKLLKRPKRDAQPLRTGAELVLNF